MRSQAVFTSEIQPVGRGAPSLSGSVPKPVSPVVVAIALSLAVHAGLGLYFALTRFVAPPELNFLDEAVLVEMNMPRMSPPKAPPAQARAAQPSPPKAAIRTRPAVVPVVSDMAPLPMIAEAPVPSVTEPVPAPSSAPVTVPAPSSADNFVAVDVDLALTRNPSPAYPPKARMAAEQGTVWLRLRVREDGTVGEVQVKTSSGSSRLDSAARDTVKRWTFSPARRNGQPVESWVNVPIRFSLKSQ